MPDAFNHGLESDRLTASWFVQRPDVEARLAGQRSAPAARDLLASQVPLLTRCELVAPDDGQEQYVRLVDTVIGQDAATMLVEVPSNFQAVKRIADADAHAWRYGTRSLFTDLFSRGYALLDFAVDVRPGALTRCYYVVGRLEPAAGAYA
jgi:predicted GNAT superfamily acetyltransferase